MTTTAFYHQLTEEPQPMDAQRTQTERAEAAEAELLAVRDDNHSMMLEIHNLRIERDALVAELAKLRKQKPVAWMREDGNLYLAWQKDLCLPEVRFSPLYAAPVPAVAAPAVPDDIIPDGDDFNGTTPHMIKCIESLVAMNDRGILVPHGLCGHSRTLLLASANRLRQQAAPAVAAGLPAIGPYRDFIPAPAVPAPSVPEEWREVMTELADDLAIEIDQSYPLERRAYLSEQRRYEGEMAIVNRARAMLQSAEGCCSHSERGAP